MIFLRGFPRGNSRGWLLLQTGATVILVFPATGRNKATLNEPFRTPRCKAFGEDLRTALRSLCCEYPGAERSSYFQFALLLFLLVVVVVVLLLLLLLLFLLHHPNFRWKFLISRFSFFPICRFSRINWHNCGRCRINSWTVTCNKLSGGSALQRYGSMNLLPFLWEIFCSLFLVWRRLH